MIAEMNVRCFSEKTRNDYIRNVRAFAAFIGRSPDTATAEDLRRFQHHQATDRRAAAKHQQHGRSLAFLLHRDARSAGLCPPPDNRARTAPAAGHPQCGETVLIARQYAYRGAELVVIPPPDGPPAFAGPITVVLPGSAGCSR